MTAARHIGTPEPEALTPAQARELLSEIDRCLDDARAEAAAEPTTDRAHRIGSYALARLRGYLIAKVPHTEWRAIHAEFDARRERDFQIKRDPLPPDAHPLALSAREQRAADAVVGAVEKNYAPAGLAMPDQGLANPEAPTLSAKGEGDAGSNPARRSRCPDCGSNLFRTPGAASRRTKRQQP